MNHQAPENVDVSIVDGNFILHTLVGQKTSTYGSLARLILMNVTALSKN